MRWPRCSMNLTPTAPPSPRRCGAWQRRKAPVWRGTGASAHAACRKMMLSFAKAHHQMARIQWAGLAECRRDRSHSLAELMQGFHGTRAYVARLPAKHVPRGLPAATAPRPAAKPAAAPAAPMARVTADLFKPTAPPVSVKAAPKTTPAAAKPWPSTPPRGESAKPVVKKAPVKAVAVKAPPPKAAAPKAKAKAKPGKAKRK